LTVGDNFKNHPPVNPELRKELDQAVESLRAELGDNLYSCCLYGSAVRGNLIEGVSDLNLLIVLNESNSGAHEAVARAIGGSTVIDPFIVARPGLPRTTKAFAPKFASIRRHYEIL
jgi:predicted nucleotidyltransferase